MCRDLWRRVSESEIVHIHGLWTFSTASASRICTLRRAPYVLSPRGALLGYAISQKYIKKKIYRFLVEDWTVRHAAMLHFTAEHEREGGPGRYRSIPSVVVPNPMDLDDLLAVPEPEKSPHGFSLLICGRIHKTKGFDLLIPALARARKDGFDIRIRIAGGDEGGYRGEVEAMARDHAVEDLLQFTGNLDKDELVVEYAKASGLIMPSYQENFGMSAAEAMSAARPVIVSDTVGIAGEVELVDAGIVTKLDSSNIAEAMIRLARDPDLRSRMGKNGRNAAREMYSREAVAGKLVDAYREVVAG
jgi:glycosyltransferase involved in cell wall biosynthesis